jgi:hypothetical protein
VRRALAGLVHGVEDAREFCPMLSLGTRPWEANPYGLNVQASPHYQPLRAGLKRRLMSSACA